MKLRLLAHLSLLPLMRACSYKNPENMVRIISCLYKIGYQCVLRNGSSVLNGYTLHFAHNCLDWFYPYKKIYFTCVLLLAMQHFRRLCMSKLFAWCECSQKIQQLPDQSFGDDVWKLSTIILINGNMRKMRYIFHNLPLIYMHDMIKFTLLKCSISLLIRNIENSAKTISEFKSLLGHDFLSVWISLRIDVVWPNEVMFKYQHTWSYR